MKKTKLETDFQSDLKDEIRAMFPGCMIQKMDAGETQGIPDLLILHNKHWATLENKRHKNATHQPNQDYYVNLMDGMSFSRFIYPENKEDVLNELREAFKS